MVEFIDGKPTDTELDSMVDKIEEFGRKFKPAKGKYYIILDDFQTSVGGIELSEKHSEQTRIGTIIACGEQVDEYTPLRYKKGDKIFIEFHSGTKLHVLRYFIIDEKFRLVFEEEILGQLKE